MKAYELEPGYDLRVRIRSETQSIEKVKARYSFKKGKKNQEAMDKIARGNKHY